MSVHPSQSRASLQGLKECFKTCFCSRGRAKMMLTFAGHSQLSSGSHSIADHLLWEDPLCVYIGAIVKALPDFGLYCGTVVASFLSNVHSPVHVPSLHQVGALLERAKTPIDLTVGAIRPLVATVLSSKPILAPQSQYECSLQVVKAALLSLSSDRLGHLIVDTSCGPDTFLSFSGILYHLEFECERAFGEMRVVLFSESITDQLLDTFKVTLRACVNASVGVLACQKVIEPQIKLALREAGIFGVERMGVELARGLSLILDAPPVPTSQAPIRDISPFVGSARIKPIRLTDKPYLLFESQQGVSTLFASSRTLYGPEELRRLIKQSVACALSLLTSPFVLPGGGHLEVWLCRELTLSCPPSPTLDAFKRALLETTPHSSLAFFNTRQYMSEGERPFQDAPTWDSFTLKRNALMTALETIVNVLNIGLLVSD